MEGQNIRETESSSVVAAAMKETGAEITRRKEDEILESFEPTEREIIKKKLALLSAVPKFIGKDFEMHVALNERGGGWYHNPSLGEIRVDPEDLLNKPFEYCRFVIAHEGGHRRITRWIDVIPEEELLEPGFQFLLNSIEDPRDNNFITEVYPILRPDMKVAYAIDDEFEAKMSKKGQDELGQPPRFWKAGMEYINQWLREVRGLPFDLSDDLPNDVRQVLEQTLSSAQDSWLRYPTRQEADFGGVINGKKVDGEAMTIEYARAVYHINREEIWPYFKSLIEEDIKDQVDQQSLRDENGKLSIPPDLRDKLTSDEIEELEKAINKNDCEKTDGDDKNNADSGTKLDSDFEGDDKSEDINEESSDQSKPLDLSQLSQGLRDKVRKYSQDLSKDIQDKLRKVAEEILKNFIEELNKEFENKNEVSEAAISEIVQDKEFEESGQIRRSVVPSGIENELKDVMPKDVNEYEKTRTELIPLIDQLEQELRSIFVSRRSRGWQSGHKIGRRIDIKKRIQEKAKGVLAVESKAWQKRELPKEKDYAISLLNDLSGSMRGEKIEEDFKAKVVLAEVLNRLSIKTEILGFNDRILEYQSFSDPMSTEVREKIGAMPLEVVSQNALWNDDGWALLEAAKRLNSRTEAQKFLVVISDGIPEPSPKHSGNEYDLSRVVKDIMTDTNIKLIGLGLGNNTSHVNKYYPNSVANIKVNEMATKLAELIKEVIENYDTF